MKTKPKHSGSVVDDATRKVCIVIHFTDLHHYLSACQMVASARLASLENDNYEESGDTGDTAYVQGEDDGGMNHAL